MELRLSFGAGQLQRLGEFVGLVLEIPNMLDVWNMYTPEI